MVKLICLDVDGTLVGESGDVRPAVWAATERARAAGLHLAVCSGRPAFGMTRAIAIRVERDGWHVFQNGASVVHLRTHESRSHGLPDDAPARIVAAARASGRVLEVYTDADFAVVNADARSRRHAVLLGAAPIDRDPLLRPAVCAQWIVPHADLPALLAEPHEGLWLAPSTSPMMPDTTFVNVTDAGVDKAAAVRRVAEAYGVSMAEVMMVGDGLNDVAALQAVGVAVAMANAEPEARAVAAHVVGDVERDGVVEAIEIALATGA